jgi:hypothetical protein
MYKETNPNETITKIKLEYALMSVGYIRKSEEASSYTLSVI